MTEMRISLLTRDLAAGPAGPGAASAPRSGATASPGSPTSRPGSPVARPGSPLMRPGSPLSRAGAPVSAPMAQDRATFSAAYGSPRSISAPIAMPSGSEAPPSRRQILGPRERGDVGERMTRLTRAQALRESNVGVPLEARSPRTIEQARRTATGDLGRLRRTLDSPAAVRTFLVVAQRLNALERLRAPDPT